MQDANGSRFALVLGRQDWGQCRLDDPAWPGLPTLDALWSSPTQHHAAPLSFDQDNAHVGLSERVSHFPAAKGDVPPSSAQRLGAAADANGNVYAIVDGGTRIAVRNAGTGRVSTFWPVPQAAPEPALGDFAPPEPLPEPVPEHFCGLAVTSAHYLVVGVPPSSTPRSGLLVFDLLAGGPPLPLSWPLPWVMSPLDMAARPCGGLAVLDRIGHRVWLLNRRLGMEASFPVSPQAAATPPDFLPSQAPDGPAIDAQGDGPTSPPNAALPRQPWFSLQTTSLGGAHPVAIEVLPDGGILVLDEAGADGFALVSLYTDGVLQAQASTSDILRVAQPQSATQDPAQGNQPLSLRGFDFAFHANGPGDKKLAPPRLVIVSTEGNQAHVFELQWQADHPHALQLVAQPGYLPLKRYGGLQLVRAGAAQVEGDTGLLYASESNWLPLVAQRRPRHVPQAILLTVPFDGGDPDCTWHRVMLDACIPSGCRVQVASRSSNELSLLPDLPFTDEPTPLLRPDGSELPWLIEGPGTTTDAARGHGTWELLLQGARGRWLQLRLTLQGNELSTPRLTALRAWRPRFSYLQHYLPAAYREDVASADFLERFLANFEGQFTALEDRIATARALFDVRSAPTDTLDWLAGWLGLVLDPAMDEARRRQLIRHAMPLYQYRGTPQAVRLSVQLALSPCVPDADFALPTRSQDAARGVRLVESYLTRLLPPALLGETVTTPDDAPRVVTPGARWSLNEGAEGLHRRWRDWLTAHSLNASGQRYAPLPPADTPVGMRAAWASFSQATLGAVPTLAADLDTAWQAWVATGQDAGLGAGLPTRWPEGDTSTATAQQAAWRKFIAQLPATLLRQLRRWQAAVARRHVRIASHQRDTASNWPAFDLLPPPTVLPGNTAALTDWALYETRVAPMAARAHRFSVLLPISGPDTDADTVAQQLDHAQRIVNLVKPAHTAFDVKPYWALLRIGQVRLGLDTVLGLGSREPDIAPAMVLGQGHVGSGRLSLKPTVPNDRILLEC